MFLITDCHRLLSLANASDAMNVMNFLCSFLPCYPVEDASQIDFVLNSYQVIFLNFAFVNATPSDSNLALQEIIDTLMDLKNDKKINKNDLQVISFDVLSYLASTILLLHERNYSLYTPLQLMRKLLGLFPFLSQLPSLFEFISFLILIIEVSFNLNRIQILFSSHLCNSPNRSSCHCSLCSIHPLVHSQQLAKSR